MKTHIRNLYALCVTAICVTAICLLTSCDDIVEVEQPNSQLTATGVFESRATADAAVADIYAQLRETGLLSGKTYGLSNILGVYSDDLVYYGGTTNPVSQFYNNALLPSNAAILSLWNAAYNQIYAANAVYERAANTTALSPADKSQFQGEALFIRALNHFYLTSLFGDVPYISGTNYATNNTVTRMPREQVMSMAIADLETAITLLPAEYPTADRARPNKSVAQALLARVYLYNNDWAESANLASAVINENGTYSLDPDLNNGFLRESTGTIWQLASAYEGRNTDEGSIFIFESGPPTAVALSEELLQSFEPGDLRKALWTLAVTGDTNTWIHPYKYKQRNDTGASVEYSIMLRLSEQYLIRAEARARQGELIGAMEDLDIIRNAAGLNPTTATTQPTLLEAILHERRVELFTEHGHRFFDLKRWGRLADLETVKLGWNDTDALWPLPQAELLANPLLTPQNPGY